MEFKSGESKQQSVPFLHELENAEAYTEPAFVERIVILAKGIMLIGLEYKATAWLGSESHEELLSLHKGLISNIDSVQKAVYMRPSLSNRKKIEVAIIEDETNKARWKRVSDMVFEASEVLTKKKAEERIKRSKAS